MKNTIYLSGIIMLMSSLSFAQKIQVNQEIYEVDPSFRYPVKQAVIAKEDRQITPFTWAKEKNHPLY